MADETDGILNIDGFNWSALKLSESAKLRLAPEEQRQRVLAEQSTFSSYHEAIATWVRGHGGSIWSTIGDCTIACGFPNIDEAVAAAQTIQRRLSDFNLSKNMV